MPVNSKSNGLSSLLSALSEEITQLAEAVVRSTAIVTGQTRDFSECDGSAWLYDAEHLVTNNHVIDGLVEPIWARFPDCEEKQAAVVGRDPLTDLAVLRISPADFSVLARAHGERKSPRRQARVGHETTAHQSCTGVA